MRLKTLEIKGFKSFANETVIHFDQDVIGVVGPNGSGKSNIVDAIRWVLGEQKGKELRLDSMGDVLFNGTKKRKKAGVAQVAITFENTKNILPTEYHTVTITRMLYRSGESEYRLNGVTCRLKDIKSLLMDTGIGSNSYAIIALGMVDDILHNKENARRRMFEQAAGISKYKRRKHETLLKLKNTTEDLDRVEDLLYEIENNLKMLEKQARRTKRYTDLKDKYKVLAIDMAIRKTANLNDRFRNLEKQITTEKDVLRQHEADLSKREAQLQQIKKDNLNEEKAVGSRQRELNILVGKIRSLESEKGLKEQETLFLEQSVKKLRKQAETNASRINELASDLEVKMREFSKYAQETEQRKSELDDAEVVKTSAEEKYNASKEKRDSVSGAQRQQETEYINLEKSIASQDMQISQTQGMLERMTDEHAQMIEELESKNSEKSTLEERLEQLNSELQVMLTEEEERRARHTAMQTQIDELKDQIRKSQRTADAKKHERDLLKDMIEKLEGYPASIKFLAKSKNWSVKAPLLSDVIYCEPEYRVIVENVLSANLNDYVVDTVSHAAQAIQLLSDTQKGKASFFILDRVQQGAAIPESVPEAEPLMNFIQCDAKYEHLVKSLLGNVWITSGSPLDETYSASEFESLILSDLKGGVLRRSGMVTGGSVGLFEGKKIGRAKNVEKLDKDIVKLDAEIARQKAELDALVLEAQLIGSTNANPEIDSLRRQVQQAANAHSQSLALSERLENGIGQLDVRKKQSVTSIDQMKAELSMKRQQLGLLKQRMQQDADLWENADQEYSALMAQYSDANAQYNQVNLAYVQMHNHVQSLEREIKYVNKRRAEVQEQIVHDEAQIENELETIGEIQRDLKAIGDGLIDLYAEKKRQESELSTAEQAYFEARNTIQTLEDKIRNKNREHQNSQYLVNQLKDEHNDIRFKLASVNERLQIEFNITLKDVGERTVDETVALEELEEKVAKIRNRIENYGEINPMAVEAYDEMKERYDTINAQKQDILEAKESLLETIKEIENTATEQFLESFAQVREYFIQVFRSLFTEDDSCDLILEDPDSPLESKIRIIAKPKGKRPKSLSQLSGGEKTLTATALLFALYLLKPAPFCVFDEVDAPLDDANIQKFNKIIKKFSEQSQFVIVTHNKQTMAAVDVIYGVYMEDQGVSSLSPVDFRFLDEEMLLETVA